MSTSKQIALHAAERPDAVAFLAGARAISFQRFSQDIRRFTAALRDLELERQGMVAIACEDFYIHWLLLLACEELNVATSSFDTIEPPAAYRDLLTSGALFLADAPVASGGHAQQFLITPNWVQGTLARDPDGFVRDEPSAGDLVRVLRSSGTTGNPKRLAVTRRMYELRATRYAEIYRLTQDSRYLLIKPFSTGHSYGCATACLRAGGCVVPYFSAGGSLGVFEENGITHVSLEPHSLKLILDRLPPDFTKPANLTVVCAGSALSDDLCRRALSRMATAVTDLFGCNEVGGVAIRRSPLDENFATVCADVDVEMVDERDVRVPDGEPGWLRMKSASMADGYIGEPELTAKFFRGGWFYPGDIAVADGPRRIKLVGRGDEIVSTPGGKKATSDLEAVVMQHLGGADVGVCTLPNEEGIQEIHVAVAGGSLGQQDLLARVNGAFASLPIGRFYVVVLPTIPRNAVGKLQRARLKEMVAAAMGRR